MNKITSYRMILDYEDKFRKKSKRLIEKGYVPQGGVSICQYGRGTKIAQSFIKYEEDE